MAWTFYQLTAIDGTNRPLAWYRYDGKTPQYWDGSSWEKSETLLEKLSEGDPMLDKLNADPTTKPEISKSEGSISPERSVTKGNAMTDNLNTVPEWFITLEKGGAGSGEHEGHPFRGNGTTGGVPQAAHHDTRGEQGWSHHDHLNAATGHVNAAIAAMHAGKFGTARAFFNEAAYHMAHAADKLNKSGADTSLHQMGKAGYAINHNAGDMAELANKAANDYARALRSGADAHSLSMLAGSLILAHQGAMDAADTAASHLSQVTSYRVGQAALGAANQGQQGR
jgi:hypothetical protein